MTRRRFFVPAILIASLLIACSDDSEPSTGSPSPTASEAGGGGITSLPDEAFLTAYGDGSGTFPSDQPGLAAGDFNADGADDFAAGARFGDPDGREDAGTAYVVFGSKGLSGEVDLREAEDDLTILGARPGDGLGYAMTSGDLNGDGHSDLAIGAPFADGAGAVYIFFGPLEPGEIDLGSDRADSVLTLSNQPGGLFGDSLDIGDVNSDGADDLLVGAPFASNPRGIPAGAAFVYFGLSDGLSSPSPDVAFYGAEQFDELGNFVIAADLNADGADDIVATAEAADGPDNSRQTAGEVHVLYGGEGRAGTYEVAEGEANLSIYGAAANDTLGFSLAAADLNGDGADEIAVSARLATPTGGRGGEGIVYLLRGGESIEAASEIDLAEPPPDIRTIAGTDPGGLLATSLAIIGGDVPALVLGGSLVDLSAMDSGAVYVLPAGYPEPGAVDALARHTFDGAQLSAHAGANIASGDFNDDGRPDLAIIAELAPGPDDSRPEAGRVYLITP